jgi:hypothetical protein
MEARKKFLTICEGGIVRSVSLAAVLRWDFKQDAVPLSGAKSSDEVISLLSDWAEYIIVMWNPAVERIPKRNIGKIRLFDVGPDIWGNPMHPELRDLMGLKAEEWKRSGWAL